MKDKIFNIVSPIIFLTCGGMLVFLTHLAIRGFRGLGMIHPTFLSQMMLCVLVTLVLCVWGTLAYVGYQVFKISKNE